MKHRKLRIAWSVAWGIAAVLMIALWVRSYQTLERAFGPLGSAHVLTIDVVCGKLCINHVGPPSGIINGPSHWLHYSDEAALWLPDANASSSLLGVKSDFQEGEHDLVVPLWAPTFACAIISASVWLAWWPNRFSLRTLLVATTLVAVVLGLIVWLGS